MSEAASKSVKKPQDRLRSRKKPMITKVWIPVDAEVALEQADLEKELSMAELRLGVLSSPENAEAHVRAKKALETFKTANPDNEQCYSFKAMRRIEFQALIKNHPPTDAEREEVIEAGGKPEDIEFSPATFPQELIAVTMIQEEMSTLELIEWLNSDAWNQEELVALFNAAYTAQMGRMVSQMGKD